VAKAAPRVSTIAVSRLKAAIPRLKQLLIPTHTDEFAELDYRKNAEAKA
jgi:hypothetical protein